LNSFDGCYEAITGTTLSRRDEMWQFVQDWWLKFLAAWQSVVLNSDM
jgi:hypothetical protein